MHEDRSDCTHVRVGVAHLSPSGRTVCQVCEVLGEHAGLPTALPVCPDLVRVAVETRLPPLAGSSLAEWNGSPRVLKMCGRAGFSYLFNV